MHFYFYKFSLLLIISTISKEKLYYLEYLKKTQLK